MQKKIIQILAVVVLVLLLWSGGKLEEKKYITDVYQETIQIPGITGEYTFLFAADTHFTAVDEEDTDQIKENALARSGGFVNGNGFSSMAQFPYLIERANRKKYDALLLGGDIIDFPTKANIDFLDKNLAKLRIPYLYTLGNHDFTFPWEYFTEKSYDEYLPMLKSFVPKQDGWSILELDEFLILSVDNSTDQFNKKALDGLNEAFGKNKPVIVLLHVPLEPKENDTLLKKTIEVWGEGKNGRSKVLLGSNGKRPNEDSTKFMEKMFEKDSPVAAILTGHIHFYHKDNLEHNVVQIITDASYKGAVMEITIKGQ